MGFHQVLPLVFAIKEGLQTLLYDIVEIKSSASRIPRLAGLNTALDLAVLTLLAER